MSNVIKTVQALKKLGLNVETGKSPVITPEQLEMVSGVRQVSNGCRIIRDDQAPFSMFKVQRFYKSIPTRGEALVGIQFTGFRDVLFQNNITREKLNNKVRKIKQLQKAITKDRETIENLKGKSKAKHIYSYEDLPKYFSN